MRFCRGGTGGADSGVGGLTEGPDRDFGRKMVEARLSLLPPGNPEDPSSGAVWGVTGVYGVEGVNGVLPPLMRAS